ncbi:serine protease [Streptomyces sp. cf386]|uniref:S8 family peptidase n=1 Tax=Streptomyces sp. cf386 TaxID=1761904 RepID=UPI00088BB192|nr:S8 family peptidase [Streptomyces sp. cf386]SDO04150.1 serine protease [Streptomyces sp. cf386]
MQQTHRKSRRGRILVAAALGTTLLGVSAVAMAGQDPSAPSATNSPASPKSGSQTALRAERTSGLIVGYKSKAKETRSAESVREGIEAAGAGTGEKPSYQRRLGNGAALVDLGGVRPAERVAELMDRFRADPDVAYVVPDRRMQAQSVTSPNDPRIPEQWNLSEAGVGFDVPDAWGISTGQGVTIAVLDTGIANHSDLAANIVPGFDFVSDDFAAKDGDGRDSDPSDPGNATKAGECGTDAEGKPVPEQDLGSSWHGTHMAGIAAAASDNGQGIAGVAPGAKVQSVRVLGRCGGANSDIIDAITWASGGNVPGVADNETPAEVINMSLGGPGSCDPATQSAIDGAVQRGSTVVVSAGNKGGAPAPRDAAEFTPGNCRNVITVAATDREGDRAEYSNFGSVDVAAPGGDTRTNPADGILSTFNSGGDAPASESFAFELGTSQAAAHVSGLSALLIAADPALTPADIEQAVKDNARPVPGTCPGGCGAGLADAAKTVEGVSKGEALPAPGSPSTPPGTGQPTDGTDLGACLDNACEVEVTGGDTIRLDGTAGVGELKIDSVADNTLTMTGSSDNGTQQSTASQTAPGRSTINDLVVDLISTDGDRAVIRLS